MAELDLNSLVPVGDQLPTVEGGETRVSTPTPFDINKLVPVDPVNASVSVFDDVRGKTYEVPNGMPGKAIDMKIGVEHEGRKPSEYFGFIDTVGAVPFDIAKGFWKGVLEKGQSFIQPMIASGEALQESQPDFTVEGVEPGFTDGESVNFGEQFPDKTFGEAQADFGRELSSGLKGMINRLELEPSSPESGFSKFIFDLGSATSDVATSVGLAVLMKDPKQLAAASFALFGTQGAADFYERSRAEGKTPSEARLIALGGGSLTGVINAIGVNVMAKSIRLGNAFGAWATGAANEFLNEATDQASGDVYGNLTGIQKKEAAAIVKDALYAGMLASILGGAGARIGQLYLKSGHVDALVEIGVPKAKAEEFLNRQTEKTLKSLEFQKEAVQMAKDELSQETMLDPERVQGLRELNKSYDEIEAKLQEQFVTELGAEDIKQKVAEEMKRIDSIIATKVQKIVEKSEDKQLKGRAKELINQSDDILNEIDVLEARKSEMEANSKATTSVDKKIAALVNKHKTTIENKFDELVGDGQLFGIKLESRRNSKRIDLLTRRAEAIVKEVDALQEGQNAVRSLEMNAEIKVVAKIEDRLEFLTGEYDRIDAELADLLIDRNVDQIKFSDKLALTSGDLKQLSKHTLAALEESRERLQQAITDLAPRIDKQVQQLSNRVATIARQNEKKRIEETLRLLKAIKNGTIKKINIDARNQIEAVQAAIKATGGTPTIAQLTEWNEHIQLIKEEGKRMYAETVDLRQQRHKAQVALLMSSLGVKVDPKTKKSAEGEKGIRAFHGTTATKFDKFSEEFSEMGYHFGTRGQAEDRVSGIKGARVDEYLLDIKNPYDVVSDLGDWSGMDMLREYFGPANEGPFTQKQVDSFKAPMDFVKGLEKQGYDGIKYENAFEDNTGRKSDNPAYIAFRPEQIKNLSVLEAEKYAEIPQEEYISSQQGKGPLTEKARHAWYSERALTLGSIRLYEMMGSAFKTLFFSDVNRAWGVMVENKNTANERGVSIYKENHITTEELASILQVRDELGAPVTVDGKPVTIDEAMHIYATFGKDELHTLALIYDNGISIKKMEQIVNGLAPKYKRAVDMLTAEMASHAPRMDLAVRDYTDGAEKLEVIDGIRIPIHRDMQANEAGPTDPAIDALHEVDMRKIGKQMYVDRTITTQRIQRDKDGKLSPVRLGFSGLYTREIERREHFIGMGRVTKDLNALLRDESLAPALMKKFGKNLVNQVQQNVNVLTSNALQRGFAPTEWATRMIGGFLRKQRHATAIVHLGFNIVSAAKVPISILAASTYVNPLNMKNGLWSAYFDPAAQEFAYKNDPQLAAGEFSREQQEMKNPLKAIDEGKGVLGVVRKHSFTMVRFLDQKTRVGLWLAAYNQHRGEGTDLNSHADAVKFAQEVVIRSQPATQRKDYSALFGTNDELLNAMQQFTHQLSQNYGVLTHDIPRAVREGRLKNAMSGAFGLIMMSLLEYAISHGRLPLDPEDWSESQIEGALMMIPLVGPLATAMHNGFGSGLPPALDITFVKPVKAIGNLVEGDFAKALDNSLYFAAGLGKLPYTQIRRTLTGGYDLVTGDTDDYRRLIWSSYMLDNY